MNHHYKELTGFQVGEIVRVNEALPGQPPIYWKGKIVKIHTAGRLANIEDINPNSSYHKEVFSRLIQCLAHWKSEDEVNI